MLSPISTNEVKFIVRDKLHARSITNLIIVHVYETLNKRYAPEPKSTGRKFAEDVNHVTHRACESAIAEALNYPTNLQAFLQTIVTNFEAEITNIVKCRLLPYSRFTILELSGPKTLQECLEKLFWYPLGISRLNPKLWCKHWTLKRECRTCKIMTLFLLRRDPRIVFPPKDILKIIFNRLPKEHLLALTNPPPFETCLRLEEAGPRARVRFNSQARVEPPANVICGVYFVSNLTKYPLPLICCKPIRHMMTKYYWVCADHYNVANET